uniref:Calpain_III domain-containing protein n=1 Tax=Heterorhabditis bacteriophora TaxID=37862 RepID=A0A1I7WSD2_HETBA
MTDAVIKRYHEEIFYGEWTTNGAKSGAPNDFAGGCLNFSGTFCNNPQYMFDITHSDSEVMFALTQKELNEGQKRRDPYVTIGMHVMKVENNRIHRVHQPMAPAGTSDYANARSVFLHLREMAVGRYILLPTTFAPREQTAYMLRIYSNHDIKPVILTKHAPRKGFCGCKMAETVTRINIHGALIDGGRDVNAYCVLESYKIKVRTATIRGTTKPEWNEQYVFHRWES